MSGTSGTVRTISYLLENEFQDGQPPGSITPQYVRDLIVSLASLPIYNPNFSVTAAGTTQATATSISAPLIVVTSGAASSGVIDGGINLSTEMKILNRTGNVILLYPRSGAQFESFGANVAVEIQNNSTVTMVMATTTQGYVW